MPLYEIQGYLLPPHRKISFPIEGHYHWEDDSGFISDISVNITESVIKLKCETNQIASPSEENQIRFRALGSVRAMTGAASFIAGLGITPVLTTMIKPDGTQEPLDSKYSSLEKLVTAFDLGAQSLTEMCVMVGGDLKLLFVFNDLIDSITSPLQAVINCGRAIEGIRLLMAPAGVERNETWRIMRENLNIDQSYLKSITDESVGPRHGDRSGVTDLGFQISIERSWTVMNRYLEFRTRAEKPLTAPEFPLLT
jgi:hypothetical protein